MTVALHAEEARAEENLDGFGTAVLVLGVVELTPIAFGIADVVGQPRSKTYGGFEVALGGGAAAFNIWVAADSCRNGCDGFAASFAAFAVIDLAVAAHGVFVLTRPSGSPPLTIQVGSVRARFTPTVVQDSHAAHPAFGLGGSF